MGKLVLGGFVSEDLQQIEKMVQKGIAFEVAEFIVLGIDHAEIGARILKKWAFPEDLVNAVNWHHNPETCDQQCTLSDIVHIANVLGLMVGFGKVRDGLAVEPAAEVIGRLGLRSAHLEALAEQTREGVDKLTDTILA